MTKDDLAQLFFAELVRQHEATDNGWLGAFPELVGQGADVGPDCVSVDGYIDLVALAEVALNAVGTR
jgi:hypothetical protein